MGTFAPCTQGSRAATHCSLSFCFPAEYSINPPWNNPPTAGLILQWHLRREVLGIACHLGKAEQDRLKITQILKEMRRRRKKSKTWHADEGSLQDVIWLGRKTGKRKQNSLTIPLSPPRVMRENRTASIGYDGCLDRKDPDAKTAVIKFRHLIKWCPSGAPAKPMMMKTHEILKNAGVLSLVGREEQIAESWKIKNSKGWLSDLRGKQAAGVPMY